MIAPKKVYPKPTESIVFLYDVRIPGGAEAFHRHRWAWAECGDVEALDQHHFALIVRPGGAQELPS